MMGDHYRCSSGTGQIQDSWGGYPIRNSLLPTGENVIITETKGVFMARGDSSGVSETEVESGTRGLESVKAASTGEKTDVTGSNIEGSDVDGPDVAEVAVAESDAAESAAGESNAGEQDEASNAGEQDEWATSYETDTDRLSQPWYRTGIGLTIIFIDIALTVGLMLATVTTLVRDAVTATASASLGFIPWYVYVFSALGGLGYVFTALLEEFHSTTGSLVKYNLRVPAALPLGAGVWILSDVLLDASANDALVVGLVFLTGLYVNLAYERLGALARRLLPNSRDDDPSEQTSELREAEDGVSTEQSAEDEELHGRRPEVEGR